ncbi:Wzz/FepE/Etk N-terminal domain-containing protein [Pseudomonas aeruginosa]|uniref:Wzz/FepE/Etk N-terminal domain-containing protein n=1 Tax=Pseudomonas aeruginosa TaxID=287 RepID=UPI00223C802D|nr:Wzz/FepE/Etk N-terminal domain-containing protein [Pseudomonas aeruginosa]
MPSSQLPGASPSEIDLVQLFQQLWASKWLIALIAALATAAALAYALLAVPTYQVDVLLRPRPCKNAASDGDQLLSDFLSPRRPWEAQSGAIGDSDCMGTSGFGAPVERGQES